jgi:hypothetical protein
LAGVFGAIPSYETAYGKKNAWMNWLHCIIGGEIKNDSGAVVQTKPAEISRLWTTDGDWTPLTYLKYKFLGTHPTTGEYCGSAWVIPFWASLAGWIASKLPLPIPSWARVRRPLGKLATGGLVISTIGALALPGCPDPDGHTNSATRTYSNPQGRNYVYGK